VGSENAAKKPSSLTLQVRFTTKHKEYSIPDFPFLVDAQLGADGLNALVNQDLKDDGVVEREIDFDFLIGGEFLRSTLEDLVLRHEELIDKEKPSEEKEGPSKLKIGVEEVIDVEYLERTCAPEPENVLMHDDWVAAVDCTEKWILTGSYDGTLHLWSIKGKHRLAIPAHGSPVKAVCWVTPNDSEDLSVSKTFASGSHDQTIMIWEWDSDKNKISCKWVCKGHKRSVDSVSTDPSQQRLASGSWDGELKIWSASLEGDAPPDNKKSEKEGAGDENMKNSRTPIMTLAGHKESISSVCWSDPEELLTSSWDHTIKLWDVETGGLKSELVGNKAFFGMSWSNLNNTIITCSADRHIRLYDPRSKEGSLVKSMFTSHSGWVSTVNWSTTDENLFISGAHDNLLKLWDRRSCRAPLYNMSGYTDKVLCSSWENPELIMGGGADNSLRMFKSNAYKT